MTTLYSLLYSRHRHHLDVVIKSSVLLLLGMMSVNSSAADKLILKNQKNSTQITIVNNKASLKNVAGEEFQESAGGSQLNASQSNISQLNAPQPIETLDRKLSPEALNRLQRELYEYNSTVDPSHIQIEERRKLLYKRLIERFEQSDPDNDGTMSRIEAAEFMPQIARHFSTVDTNNDDLISLEELAIAQNKAVERRMLSRLEPSRVEPVKLEAKVENGETDAAKRKVKHLNSKKQ